MITQMTTGAPKMGVMTLMGMTDAEGMVEMRLHTNARQAPVRSVAGKSVRWLAVPSRRRAMWGTANPTKAIGPQKAVEVAVSRPVVKSNMVRVRLTLMPKLVA